jgi:LmbE family N-acetylglucosaminyl deacetylase
MFQNTISRKSLLWLLLLGIVVGIHLYGIGQIHEAMQEPLWPELRLNSQDRVLILAPHPDDEVLGCGGVIQKALRRHIPVRVVFFTYGDNNEWSFLVYRKRPVFFPKAVRGMGMIRHNEAISADRVLGLTPEQLTFLGYPDFGTLQIWDSSWGEAEPFKSMLTKVTRVPYQDAFRPGAPYKGEEILKDLKTIIASFKPTKIFLSHPADHNPDHRALYLFTRIALWDLREQVQAQLFPYLVHFLNWPHPRGYYPFEPLESPDLYRQGIMWRRLLLSWPEINLKIKALKEHRSQFESSGKYLSSFIRTNELFGDFQLLTVKGGENPAELSRGQATDGAEIPNELTDQEKAHFIGVEERYVSLRGNHLGFSFEISRPLAKEVGVSIFIFGYRDDRSFAQMPKLRVRLGALKHRIFDKGQELPGNILDVTREGKRISLRIPLEIIGNPQKILFSARTYLGEVPLDWTSWRILELVK